MSVCRIWILIALVVAVSASSSRAQTDRIRYDRHCLSIDRSDTFVFSGTFHYFRCPKQLWRERFEKMKLAGLNTVETYIPWNYHEPAEPADTNDFSKIDLSELDEWLRMAEDEFGFYVILRPGPFICAEWDHGGYPQWLVKHRKPVGAAPFWLRSDEAGYLAWCRHWYQAAAEAVLPHLLTHRQAGRKGVILWQVENEYDTSWQPPSVMFNQVKALASWSRQLGIDVPVFTCLTSRGNFRDDPFLRDNIIETRNSYPNFDVTPLKKEIEFLSDYQPEKFKQITELQGGFFTSVGDKPDNANPFTPAQISQITLLAMERGVTSLNYYMFVGGTNFADHAPRNITSSYDYHAPIHEAGGVDERWRAVAAIGQMLREHGPRLARADAAPLAIISKTHDDVSLAMRRAADDSRYVFVRTEQRDQARAGTAVVRDAAKQIKLDYDLEPLGANVFYLPPGQTRGDWLVDPSKIAMPTRPARERLPAPIKILAARRRSDAPANWQALKPRQTLEDLDVLDCRFVFYRAALTPGTLSATLPPGDRIIIGSQSAEASDEGVATLRLETAHASEILYENVGHPFTGAGGMDRGKGITQLMIDGKPLPMSEIAIQTTGTSQRWWESSADESEWETVKLTEVVANDDRTAPLTWYRMHFSVPAPASSVWAPWKIRLDATGNGPVYLNGHALGRYWQVGPQHEFFLPACWLNVGEGQDNVITICLRPTDQPAALKSAEVSVYAEQAELRER
jgi:hypothetical protein